MHSVFVFLGLASGQGQWAQRIYYNDNQCQGEMTMLIQVFIPQAPCQSTLPLDEVCEVKSNGSLKSSEGTGCSSTLEINDEPWLPTKFGSLVADSNYMTLNHYTSADCTLGQNVSIEQNIFV
jgi:hypothetical protein